MSDRNAVLRAAMELPPEERYELVVELWDSIELAQAPLSDEQKAFLQERLGAYDPNDMTPWEEVRKRFLKET